MKLILNGILFLSLLIFGQNNFAQTPLKQEAGSLTTANGPTSIPQVVTYFDGAAAYSPTTTVTYTYSNQQFGTGTTNPIEGIATLNGMLFGGNSASINTAPAGFPRNSLMNGISSPTDALFKACAACATGSITVANDYAVGLQSLTDGFINSSNQNLQPLNGRIYMGDLTISFNRPVSNPVFQFVGMGGQNFYTIDPGTGLSNVRNYEMGWATEFDLVGTDVVLSKFAGNAQLEVTGAQINNNATFKGASSVGAAAITGGVVRFAASGSILATGTNITSITLKIYLHGDGGRITNGSNVVTTGLNGRTPQWSLAPNNYTNSTGGNINSDVYLIGVTLQKPVSISGNVFNDPNAGNVDNSSGTTNLVPTGMSINLLDANGIVVATVPVATNGTYSIPAIFEGTYTTSLSTTAGAVGSIAPPPSTPVGWLNTGEFIGTPNTGSDGTLNGISAPFTVAATAITNVNFGIALPPKYTISGNVFKDSNGATNVDGIGLGRPDGVQLYASLIGPSGTIIETVPVSVTGTYTFTAVVANTYNVVVSTNSAGSTTTSLPVGWSNVSEDCCDNTGNDGTTNGINTVTITNANLTNVNFGIEIPPLPPITCNPINSIPCTIDWDTPTTQSATVMTYVVNCSGRIITVTLTRTSGAIPLGIINGADGSFGLQGAWLGQQSTSAVGVGENYTITYSEGGVPIKVVNADLGFWAINDNCDGNEDLVNFSTNGPGTTLLWTGEAGGDKAGGNCGPTDGNNAPTFVGGVVSGILDSGNLAASIFNAGPGTCCNDGGYMNFQDAIGFTQINFRRQIATLRTNTNLNANGFTSGYSNGVVMGGDNYDKSTSTFCILKLPVTVSGNVYNDPLGGNVNNSSGVANLVPTGMNAVLVDNATGLVVATVPVNADGTYTIPGVFEGNYQVVLSTTAGVIGTSAPAPSLPTDWARTGDFNGTPNTGNTAPNDGISANFGVTTTNVTNINFGIQQVPETAINLQPSQVNPGGSVSVIVPASAFQTSNVGINPITGDPTTPGTVTSIKIPNFPTGATSITVGGTTYLSTDSIWGTGGLNIPYTDGVGPTPAISVDPLPGVGSVVIPIIAVDNLGNQDPTPGNVTLPFTNLTVTGNVFNDPNAGNVNNSTGSTNLVPAGMTANLLDNATGLVIGTATVGTDGVYNFGNVDGGNYKVVLSTTPGTIGSAPPAPSIPTDWVNTGEFNGTPDTGTTGPADGISANFSVTNVNVTNINFGIEFPPTPVNSTQPSVINPGGIVNANVPPTAFSGTDPSGGIISSIKITGIPANATTITINGITYGPSFTAFPVGGVIVPTNAAGNPTQTITVDPIDGNIIVDIPYKAIDNAGVESLTSAIASLPFYLVNVSGTVFNDLDANLDGNVDGTGTNAGGLYAILLNSASQVVATTPVGADGLYSFSNVAGGTYAVILTTTIPAQLTVNPTPTLPATWESTGEINGLTGFDATVNTKSEPFVVTTADVPNINFGIEQPPITTSEILPGVTNPGGSVNIDVASTGFNAIDPSGGTVVSIKITSFPTGITSITIDGVLYTTISAIQAAFPNGIPTNNLGEPTVPITVDPLDGVSSVIIPYVAIDNGGLQSNISTVTIPLGYSISGKLWDNGGTGNVQDPGELDVTDGAPATTEISTGGLPIFAVLTDAAGNVILNAGIPLYSHIQPNGTYNIGGVPNGDYFVKFTTDDPTVTSPVTPNTGSVNWVFNENQCGTVASGTCTSTDTGSIPVTMNNNNVVNVNQGLDKLPTSNDIIAAEQINNGPPTNQFTAPLLVGDDLEDGAQGVGSTVIVTSFPTNATTIVIGGVSYTSATFPPAGVTIPSYNANSITVDPTFPGEGVVTFTYVFVDASGNPDPTPATVTMPFTNAQFFTINAFNDTNGQTDNLVNGATIQSPSTEPLYAVVRDAAGVIQKVIALDANGQAVYGDANDEPITQNAVYTITITTDDMGATKSLPNNWVNTGESATNLIQSDLVPSDGIMSITTVSNNSTFSQVVNFGIDFLPTAESETLPVTTNPGGILTTPVPLTAFLTDDADGGDTFGVTKIRIMGIPPTANSITIDGVLYGLGGIPFPIAGLVVNADPVTGQPVVPISIDPKDNVDILVLTYFPIDGAGFQALAPATITIPIVNEYKLTGTAFIDPDGDTDVDGTGDGTPGTAATQLYVSLASSAGVVLQSIAVNPDGSYQFNNLSPNTNYTVVLSTAIGAIGQPTPAPSIPAGFQNTGDDCCDNAGTDGTSNGILTVSIAMADQINANFGIQQPPTANIITLTPVVNPGGTNPSVELAASFGGDDPDGDVVALKITSFPTNATSITIDGVPYTSLAAIQAAYPNGIPTSALGVPNVTIVVDPVDGAVTVDIPYITIDNAGAVSAIPGKVSIPFTTVNVSGTVHLDADGPTDGINDGVGTNGGGLFATLLNSSGNVVSSVPVVADGTYLIPNVNGGAYSVIISPVQSSTGASAPNGYESTGEFIGTGTGTDGTVDAKSASFTIVDQDRPNVDFGIQKPPTANIVTLTPVVNPSGTNPSVNLASSFGGADPDGNVEQIRITDFPTNATSITIGAITYGPNDSTWPIGGVTIPAPGGVVSTLITVDPIDGDVTVNIPYVTIDNAGTESPVPGAVNVPYKTVSLSGNAFNDVNGLNPTPTNTVDGTGTDAGGLTAILVDSNTGLVLANAPVSATGEFSFGSLGVGSYKVVLATAPVLPGALEPATASLPAGWLNTGENNDPTDNMTLDAGSDGTVNGKSLAVSITTTDIINVNFGIQQPPTADIVIIDPIVNPGGTNSSPVPTDAFGGTDTSGGTVEFIKITEFPTGATSITIGPNTYTDLASIQMDFPNGIPTNDAGEPIPVISVDPIANGTTEVVIPYVTIDNAGAESPIPGSVTVPFIGLNISGTVFNDPNAGNVNNSIIAPSTDNFVPAGMTAYLIKGGLIVGLATVSEDGTYSIDEVPAGTGYSLVISTGVAAIGDATPVATAPTGWLNTGEFTGTPNTGNDGVIDGTSVPFNLTTADQVEVNFAIQQPPTADIVITDPIINPGGTDSSPVPGDSFGGTDPDGGTIEFIKIIAFPTGATSITIGPNIYTDLVSIQTAFPNGIPTNDAGEPIPTISVDPSSAGVTEVIIPYFTIDNAGAESPIPGSVTVPFITIDVSGTVFNDPNAGDVNNSSGDANSVPAGVFAYLVKDGTVIGAGAPVATDGTFVFANVAPGIGYSVVISTTLPVGTTPPPVTLPADWLNTGEFNGAPDGGTDAIVNGISASFDVVATDVVDRNFGIQQPPTANLVDLGTEINPGGEAAYDVTSSFGGSDPTTDGVIESITITSLPANVTSITINEIPYGTCPTCTAFPVDGVNVLTDPNGVPLSFILIDPVDGNVVVSIPYVTIDNAGAISPVPGEVKVAFEALRVSGNVFNDSNAGNVNNSSGEPANVVPTGMTAYLVKDGEVVGAGAPVASDGTFSFANVAPSTGYSVVISTTPPVGITPPPVTLPADWLSTGEFNGAPDGGSDAAVNGISETFDVVATDVIDRNFGIQQPPTANNVDLGTVPNPGGETTQDVTSSFGGDDPTTNGIIASITITSLPPNVTSITINGIPYGTCSICTAFPPIGVSTPTDASGIPISPILIDPIDGDVVVTIPYVTIDNAGAISPIPGEVKVAFEECLMELGGTIYIDNSGTSDGVGGTPVNGTTIPLIMSLTQITGTGTSADTTIVNYQAINSLGKYNFTNVKPGIYRIVMSTSATGSKNRELPAGYLTISEGGIIGDGTGTVPLGKSSGDGTNDGTTTLDVDCDRIIFEKKLRPSATASYQSNDFGISQSSPLPIDLLTFTGKQFDEQINLIWKTANEKEFSHFEVHKSTNAKEFGSIGSVKGTSVANYNLVDKNPVEGINYYRLKMVDLDGRSQLSNVISLNFEKIGSYISIENPAYNGEFKVMTNLKDAKFKLLNSLGQIVEFKMNSINKNEFILKLNNSVSGIYYLNIESNGNFKTKKLIMP